MKPLYASKHVQWCEREAKLSLDIFAPYFNCISFAREWITFVTQLITFINYLIGFI